MPQPVPDHSTGWWSIRVKQPDGSRKKHMLGKQPGWTPGKKLPKKPPTEILLLAQKYQTMDLQIKHGVDLAIARKDDLAAFLKEYQAQHAAEHRPNSVRVLDQAVRAFLAFCEGRGVKTVQAVTPEVCGDYMRARRKAGRARSTVNVERGSLSPAWSKAVLARAVTENPWKLSPTPGKAVKLESDFWRVDELEKLIAASDGWVRDLILFSANTGARVTSALTLEWKHVHFDRNAIRFDSKTGAYTAPMGPVARDVLERLQFASKSKYVFPSADLARPRTRAVAYVAIRKAVRKSGIPERGSYNHILRHTFASHAIMQGKSLVQVSKWLGHTTIHMTMRYAHLAIEESQRQIESFRLGADPLQSPHPEPEPKPQSPSD